MGNLFDIQSTLSFNADRLTLGEEYDYVTRTSQNQGILQTTGFVNKDNINPAGTWSLGLLQMDFFYRNKPWYAGQFVRKIVPKITIPNGAKLFFQTILNMQKHALMQVLVRNVDETFSNIKIRLPQTSEGKIDFVFMEEFMRELEESRLRELEAYLLATGLNDYQLSLVDRSVLHNFKNIRWREFRVGDLFDKISTIKLNYKARELPQQPIGEYTLPCLTSSFMNQGLNYYAPRNGATILSNVISIPSNSDVYRAYYQSREFTVLSDAYAIQWKYDSTKITSKQYLFMVACINKVTDLPIYSYKNKLGGWNVVKDKYISLPATAAGQPDFAVMEELVTALQKIAITDVVKYTEQQLNAAHHIVETTNGFQMTDLLSHEYRYTELEPMMAAEPFECYKWNRFDQNIIDFFGGDKTILVGCAKNKKHLEWIVSKNLYNVRLGETKGSMEKYRNMFKQTSLLVLYDFKKTDRLSAYTISSHNEMTKQELSQIGYPNALRKSYMVFRITPIDIDLTLIKNQHLIEKLIEMNPPKDKGTPVFIEP